MRQKFYDSLVLRTTTRKKLIVRSPKVLVQNVLNKNKEIKVVNLKCALYFAQSRGLGTERNPNGPGYKAFHGFYVEKKSMASKR